MPVTVALVISRTIPLQVRAIGNVEAYSTISVKSQIGGLLTHVYFREGDMVRKGELLFQIDPRQYEAKVQQSEANLAKDAAQSENAKADARRYAELFRQGIVAQQDYEAKDSAAKALDAALSSDRAQIDWDKLQLQYTKIYSPVDGRTGNVAVKEGNLVKDNDIAMVTINQIHPIYVTFAVPEKEFPPIQRRLGSGLVVEAYPGGDQQRPVRGKLTFADNAVDQTTGTIKLKGTFGNQDNRLWPGQFMTTVLTVGMESNATLVPSQAVQSGQNGQFVFVVKSDNKVEMRPVVIAHSVGADLALSSGVQPGETVVTDGQSRLVPGATVQAVTNAAETGSSGS